MAKGKTKRNVGAAPKRDGVQEEAIFDLPKREAMSLLPSGLGSLPTGTAGAPTGGLGGGLLGGSGTTQPATAPPLPTPADPTTPPIPGNLLSPDTLAGANQSTPIAQSDSTSP